MAIAKFHGGWSLSAAGDTAVDAGGYDIQVETVVIVKATAGTVTLKDGAGTVCLLTGSLADLSTTVIPMGGLVSSGLEYDAVSAGTAVVYVYGNSAGRVGSR